MISCLLPLLSVNCLAGGKEETYRLASMKQHHSNRSFPREPKGRPAAGLMVASLHSCTVWLNWTGECLLFGFVWFRMSAGRVLQWRFNIQTQKTNFVFKRRSLLCCNKYSEHFFLGSAVLTTQPLMEKIRESSALSALQLRVVIFDDSESTAKKTQWGQEKPECQLNNYINQKARQ